MKKAAATPVASTALVGTKRKREKQELDLEILQVDEVEKAVVK